jgi:hypothetical protein
VKDLVAVGNLINTYRLAEDFLRKQPDGLSTTAREVLAARYGRFMNFYLEEQPAMFDELQSRVLGLGMRYPPGLSVGMRTVARMLGYKSALRLRATLRRMRGLEAY